MTDHAARSRLWGALAAVLALGALVRLWDLGQAPLWLDEANAVLLAQNGPAEMHRLLQLDSAPPLFFVLLHAWGLPFGSGEVAARALAALAGIALLPLVFFAGERWFGRRAALLAVLVVALSLAPVEYSRSARPYSLLALSATLATYLLWRLLEDGRWRDAAGYALAALACLYLHNHGLFLLAGHFAAWIQARGWRRRPAAAIAAAALVVLAYLPWIPTLLTQVGNLSRYIGWWVEEWGLRGGAVAALRATLAGWTTGQYDYGPLFRGGFPTSLDAIAAGSLVLVVLAARANAARPATFLLVVAAAATGLPLLSSMLTPYPSYIPGRVDQLLYPCFVLLVSAGVTSLERRWLRGVALAILAGLVAHAWYVQWNNPWVAATGSREAAALLARERRPGDAVLFAGLARAPVQYELERLRVEMPLYSFPEDAAEHLGNEDRWLAARVGPEHLARLAEERVAELLAHGGRLFVLIDECKPQAPTAACALLDACRAAPNATYRQAPQGFALRHLYRRFTAGVLEARQLQ